METNQTPLSIALKYFNAWCRNDFNIAEKEAALTKAYQFINKK